MKKVFNVFSITLLIFLALITVFPFIYMVLTGLMTYAEATSIPPSFIPSEFKFSNYLEVFSRAPFLRYFGNTLFVYTQVYALFGGTAGPANSATTAVYYIYDKFHVAGRPGVAMAATVILFAIILFATFLQNKFLRKAEG